MTKDHKHRWIELYTNGHMTRYWCPDCNIYKDTFDNGVSILTYGSGGGEGERGPS